MKILKPITPSNRHRTLILRKYLEEKDKNKYEINIKRKKSYITGKIIEKNKKIVKIDAGLETTIEISKKELNKIKNISKKIINIGDNINILIYNNETKKGDQQLNYTRFYKKIKINKLRYYLKYKVLLSFKNKINNKIKGIIIRMTEKGIIIGIGGIISVPIKIKLKEKPNLLMLALKLLKQHMK
jgi:ribosomal protein S1